MKQKRAKEGKKIPPTPGFELQVTQCLVGATLSSPSGNHKPYKAIVKPVSFTLRNSFMR